MAATANLAFVLFFASSLCIQAALGEITCETLLKDKCAFAVASSGDRCVLETYTTRGRFTEYQCKTSGVVADEKLAGYIETDECVSACGVERKSVGIGSDSLLEPTFLAKLCSPQCYQNCPNIVDLYFNLAAGEGGFLPDLCKAQGGHHRAMIELMSSGAAEKHWGGAAFAPAPAPSHWI
uniref:PAR1 protein n=1 Tax=Kalanchoe fedtschenkoi TaxID=63787 RepID=A0A7N0RHQ6_KALFE